jgi:rRNA maturation RNase YbeY
VSQILVVRNQQRARRLDTKYLRAIVGEVLTKELGREDFELGISIVGEERMTRINEGYLRHKGSTDVITFDYAEPSQAKGLSGEIFVCVDEAVKQAPRYRTTWQKELVRYTLHGVLHLTGYDDKTAAARQKMKREEDRLMRRLATRFSLERIKAKPRRGRSVARRK